QLKDAREEAAVRLLRWLTSDAMNCAESWYRDSNGAPTTGYEYCAKVFGNALTRLGESDTGTAYLSLSLNDSKRNKGKPGILRFIDEFVLPDKRHSDEHIQISFATGD